jgi:putative hydrolase of the HAD superfamily
METIWRKGTPPLLLTEIKTLVFDLDGTLYVCDDLAREIKICASNFIASLKGLETDDAWLLIENTKKRLSALSGLEATLSEACLELGGDLKNLHHLFAEQINPEIFLKKDAGLVNLLQKLEDHFELYIYTNNNRILTDKILNSLGVSALFQKVFTIESFWTPKPDASALENIFTLIDRMPAECLFVGDRYDVDLRMPANMGSAVFLSKNVQELMLLLKILYEESV